MSWLSSDSAKTSKNEKNSLEAKFEDALYAACVPAAFCAGLTTADEMVKDPLYNIFINKAIGEEFSSTLDFPESEKKAAFEALLKRLSNSQGKKLLPLIDRVIPRWKNNILPAVIEYTKAKKQLPFCLVLSMTALIRHFLIDRKGVGFTQVAVKYTVNESPDLVKYFAARTDGVKSNRGVEEIKTILSHKNFWGMDLNTIPDFAAIVIEKLTTVGSPNQGIRVAIESLVLPKQS